MPRATGGWESFWRCSASSFSTLPGGLAWGPSVSTGFSVLPNVGSVGHIRSGCLHRSQHLAKQRSPGAWMVPIPGHRPRWQSNWRCSARSFSTLPSPKARLDQLTTGFQFKLGIQLTGSRLVPVRTGTQLTGLPVILENWIPSLILTRAELNPVRNWIQLEKLGIQLTGFQLI